MRISYGVPGEKMIDVSDILLNLGPDKIRAIRKYNDVFGDPVAGKIKTLKIEDAGRVYLIPENAPIDLEMKPESWDWVTYVLNYPDLSHLKTELDAISHYQQHGKNEGRVFYPLW